MAHDASQNNPKKELAFALVGITAFLVMILSIATLGWLRPAGNHEVATVSATEAGQKLEEALKEIEKPKAQESSTAEATADTASAEAAADTDGAKTDDNADSTEATAEPASTEGTAEATAEAEATADTAKEEPAPASTEGETAKTE